MADMDPRDMTSIMGYQKPRTGSQSSSSMDPKKLSLSDMSRDQIRDMAREGSQETRQGEFGSMDAFMQRDTIERMNDDQKAKEAQHETRPRRWSFNMRDIPEEINIV